MTEIEREILRAMAHGESKKMIAAARHRSIRTIRNQLGRIYAKLQAANGPHAVYLALTRGLI